MLHRISTSIFLLLLSLGAQAQWNLIWSDEFNGTSIDPSNWVFETGGGGWGNGELENYTNRPANATVSNGNLLIIAKKENYGGNSYTSARMKTQGLHSWTYGKIEARIQIPVGKGVWPAFWMLGDTIATAGWPTCGEMDIMEHVNTDTTIEGTMHWNNNGHVQYGSHTGFHTNQYHTYAIEWDANTIKWLMDGVQYVQGNIAGNVNNTSAFHHPFFVLLNLAVGGTWPGSPAAATVFPDTLFVDYVRVYAAAVTQVGELKSNTLHLQLKPNPTGISAMLAVEGTEPGLAEIAISDLTGRICLRQPWHMEGSLHSEIPLDLQSLVPGVYFLSLHTPTGTALLKLIR